MDSLHLCSICHMLNTHFMRTQEFSRVLALVIILFYRCYIPILLMENDGLGFRVIWVRVFPRITICAFKLIKDPEMPYVLELGPRVRLRTLGAIVGCSLEE